MTALLLVCTTLIFASSSAQSIEVEFTIEEEQPAGYKIGNIPLKSNLPEKMNITTEAFSRIEYNFLTDNPHAKLLKVDSQTGDLFSVAIIDRESLPSTACTIDNSCKLKFDVASIIPTKGDVFIITVTVWVNDINDNLPIFPQPEVTFSISESACIGYIIPLPTAIDLDTGKNGITKYEMYPLNGAFRLNSRRNLDGSFQVKLVLHKPLDRETYSYMDLLVFAKDGGSKQNKGTLKVKINVLDANDNMPVFAFWEYNIFVSETLQPGTSILRVQAVDSDSGINGQIEYHFSPLQSQILNSMFSINITTGDILLRQKLVYEANKMYSLVVEGRDKGEPPQFTQVRVNVQIKDTINNPPVIKISFLASSGHGQTVSVSELSELKSFVALVNVEDSNKGKNGNVACSTSSPSFGIENLSGTLFKVITKKRLNRMVAETHSVTVTCRDFGSPSLRSSASFKVNVLRGNFNSLLSS